MKVSITTTIPVRNGQEFLLQTLESLARQTRQPDRVVVLDNLSTDSTRKIVEGFKKLPIEFVPNPKEMLDTFGNFNRCLDYASETEYLHILHADDCILPKFYEVMTQHLSDCDGLGMAWCLDERIDENNRQLSLSGKTDGKVEVLDRDTFLARKAEIGNQAFAATLLKTNYQPSPERFPLDMLILGDMVFWPKFGTHCKKIVTVNLPLAQYRWHGSNETFLRSVSVDALVVDEWRTMQQIEALRGKPPGLIRSMKLKGLLSVRAGIKAKRIRQMGNAGHGQAVAMTARKYTGLPLWLAGQFLVELRDLVVFKILGRPRHPRNVFS
jgi:glycosyltransferase involved in cell wall biosynthesis